MTDEIKERLEYLRGELRGECISYSELAELQGLARHIDRGDVELLEAAGVPEFPSAYKIVDWAGNDIHGLNGETTFASFDDAIEAVIAIADRDIARDGITESHPDYEKLLGDYRGEYYAEPME